MNNDIGKNLFNKTYSVKDTGVSYRILNNWSEKGLVNHLQDNKGEWHRFSVIEIIEVKIYDELRQLGFSIKKLLKIKQYIKNQGAVGLLVKLFSDKMLSLTPIVQNIVQTVSGENVFLVTDRDAINPSFMGELYISEVITGISPLTREVYSDGNGLILISLRRIMDSVSVSYNKENKKLGMLIKTILDAEDPADLKLIVSDLGKINKIKLTEYKHLEKGESINRLVKKPSQNIIFSTNKSGSTNIKIEKEIK